MSDVSAGGPVIGDYTHTQVLDILAAGRPATVKACAEVVLADLGRVTVLVNRTGLVMLPFLDTVRNTPFHLGEVLVSEARIRLLDINAEGYGAVTGRDLEHAMAIAVIDAAIAAGHQAGPIQDLLASESRHRQEADRERLKKVEATRVTMETF